ncbi:MFS transporter [Bradyrhizobium sp.]|uniref:MFS transporter n=1 Tax=Bradyrhizobium sp. TaxID=376 RepID=UPI00403830CF
MRIFYGWWIVVACLVAALFGNALGLFGAGVYLHAVTEAHQWSIAAISGAATLFYFVSAILLIPVGSWIASNGPNRVMAGGGLALFCGVVGIGRADQIWQAYAAFLSLGIAWACLSTTAVATTLAPWFEKHQGRAISIASLGASAGGMIGAPVLIFGIGTIGFPATTIAAGSTALIVILVLAGFVLKRRPQDLGLLPDGDTHQGASSRGTASWTRRESLRTCALRSVIAAFGLGMMVQIGYLTHQVTLTVPILGVSGASAVVSLAAVAALCGRLLLVQFADRMNQRMIACAVLLLAAAALTVLALRSEPVVVVLANAVFGLTVGNVTTLSAIIVRREFGPASFGPVFGLASCGIQLVAALGPGLYGTLRDAFGSYSQPLLVAAVLDVTAAVLIMVCRR